MLFFEWFRIASEGDKKESVARLVKAGTGDFDFYLFVILGVAMATMGLLLDSPTVIIGSMLIAPVLYPILSFSLGFVLLDKALANRSLRTVAVVFFVGLFISALLTLILTPLGVTVGEQIIARTHPSLIYFLVACISGFAATYAIVHKNLNEMLPGVAISVALVPPLAATGVGAALLQPSIFLGALVLLILNITGIALSSMVAFSLANVHTTHAVVKSAVDQENVRLEKEQKQLEQLHAETQQKTNK